MVKKTAQWRKRRLQAQAIKFGYKLSEQLNKSYLIDHDRDPPLSIPMFDDDDDTSNETKNSYESSEWKRMVLPIDVACALVLFKRRYRLSISCMNHLLKLLPYIPHNSVPTSWSAIKMLLRNNTISSPPLVSFICPSCSQSSSNRSTCSKCGLSIDSSSMLKSFRNFSISDQLHRIITTNYQRMTFRKKSTGESMRDICDGDVHRRLQDSCSDAFVTLTLNIDGIQPNKGSKKTIWPILLVVNELPIQHRFSPENIILAGVWPGPTKPSRANMTLFLKPLATELVRLEEGEGFFIPTYSLSPSNQMTFIRVYLIGACCDKPAQALVQNLPEPIAAFGCGRCELEGYMIHIEATNGYVRSFAAELDVLDDITQRCNTRYDTLLALKQYRDSQRIQLPKKAQKKQEELDRQKNCGILGPCVLRSCTIFDVGYSFMSDSLHNVYIGAFKRMLKLWLESKYRSEPWSICDHINELTQLFKKVRMPSTTTRLPRTLTDYSNFKANELRVLLLFGYVIFYNILPKKYYSHLLQLVCLLHLAENRCIPVSNITVMQKLSENFVVSFSHLYTNRHCVSVVHSIVHIAATVRDFGPLTTYTTFNFENQLGLLTRTCKSTRRHAEEMISNLQTLQCAHQHLNDSTLDLSFKQQLLSLISGKRNIDKNYIYTSRKTDKVNPFATPLFPKKKLSFFNKLQIGNLMLCTYASAVSKHGDDSTIVYRVAENLFMGRIQSIFTVIETGNTFLLIDYPTAVSYFTYSTNNNDEFTYSSIQSCLKKDFSTRLIQTIDVVEKCVYYEHSNGNCQFIRFPNLEHSS